MKFSSTFGTQHATTSSVQVSPKVMNTDPAESVKATSATVSGTDFKVTFSAASEATTAPKAQSTPRQMDEKKSTREKRPVQDTVTMNVAVPDSKASLPLSVISVVSSSVSGTGTTSPEDSTIIGTKGNGIVPAATVASLGDKKGASEIAGVLNDSDAARAVALTLNSPTPSESDGESDTESTMQGVVVAGIPPLASVSDSSASAGGGPPALTKEENATSDDPIPPDVATQAAALANTLPPVISVGSQSLVSMNESMPKVEATNTVSADKALKFETTLKSGSSKQLLASTKDRSTTADIRGKVKSEDADAESSGTEADASSATKLAVVVTSVDHQAASSHSGNAGGDAVQRAIQMETANVAPTSLPSSQSANSADPIAGAPQTAASSEAGNSTYAQEVPALNSAHLLQSMGQSEMKLGMHSAEFGSISINTSLTHQALSAQISVAHSALGQALALHLPSIQEKLGSAYGLQARVEVRDSSGSSTGHAGGQSPDGRKGRAGGSSTLSPTSGIGMLARPSTLTTSLPDGSSRLDIRI